MSYDDAELRARLDEEVTLIRLRRQATRLVDAEERPPAPFPEVLTLAERLAQPPDPVAWRVEGWLPAGGRVVLAAQAKAGKTHAAANLVRCLVDGQPWLGRDAVTQVTGKVAVIDFEMTERQLYDWYGDLGIEATDRVLILALRGRAGAFDLRDADVRARWASLLLEHGVEFVVWDCLRPVVDALGLDENHDASALLTAFDALLTEAGHPDALVVHHMGHSNERARGDSGIIGWGDANWKLVLGDDGDEHGPRWLKANGRDVAQPEVQVSRDATTRRLVVAGGSRTSLRMTAAYDAVTEVLTGAEGPMTAGAVEAAAMGPTIPRARVREALASMVALNQVTVEVGERNARLHRLNPVSSPVRGSSPEPASRLPSQFAAALYGGEVASTSTEPESAGLSGEQRAILDGLEHQPQREDTA